MGTKLRVITMMAIVGLAFLAAVNVGTAQPLRPTTRTNCAPPPATPTFPCDVPDGQGGTTTMHNADEFHQWEANLPSCAPGAQPDDQHPCKPAGEGDGQDTTPDCGAGQKPTRATPCKPPPCAPGVRPTADAPCHPAGQDGGFDQPPGSVIYQQLKNKFLVLNINVEGSGDADGSFDVTIVNVVSGVKAKATAYLNDQLAGDSFVIPTTASTKCFADTSDPDKIPDLVSCKELDDAANNAPGSIKAQFRGKVTFDAATYQPTFKAQKIVFLKGVFNVAKIK